METIKSFFQDIVDRKFWYIKYDKKTQAPVQGHDYKRMREDGRFGLVKEWFIETYVYKGYGYNSIIKEFCLPITYPALRSLVVGGLFGSVARHGNAVVTDRTRKLRSDRARKQALDPNSTWGKVQKNFKSRRGIQGFYYNKSMKKYVWLRSTYEYIYAKWLDKNGFTWDIEVRDYKLDNGELYRPDFFIYSAGSVSMIVEVKGYYKNRAHKPAMLSEKIGIKVVMITDIRPYIETGYEKEQELWRQSRLSEQQLKKLD
jgi:hypothetical protein